MAQICDHAMVDVGQVLQMIVKPHQSEIEWLAKTCYLSQNASARTIVQKIGCIAITLTWCMFPLCRLLREVQSSTHILRSHSSKLLQTYKHGYKDKGSIFRSIVQLAKVRPLHNTHALPNIACFYTICQEILTCHYSPRFTILFLMFVFRWGREVVKRGKRPRTIE